MDNSGYVVSTEEDPKEENGWRYSNDTVVSSQEGASTDLLSLNEGISTFSMVANLEGYKVFNWFA